MQMNDKETIFTSSNYRIIHFSGLETQYLLVTKQNDFVIEQNAMIFFRSIEIFFF